MKKNTMTKEEKERAARYAELARIQEKINAGLIRITVEEFTTWAGVGFTVNHTAKMLGVNSVSTSPLFNHNCNAKRGLLGAICQKCYSFLMQKRYKRMRDKLWRNSWILSEILFEENELPYLYSATGFFRFEAFGDLISEIQVVNYFRMAKVNPHMHCALWTKNPWLIKQAMQHYGIEKPDESDPYGAPVGDFSDWQEEHLVRDLSGDTETLDFWERLIIWINLNSPDGNYTTADFDRDLEEIAKLRTTKGWR